MANALLQDLAAATTLAGTDLFYVKQAGARGVKATGTQLLALVGTAYVPLAGGVTMTGALTIASGTLTASAPALSITQTWTTGATFSAALINVTDTSSNSNSLLQDWQIAGSTVARIRKDGTLFLSGGFSAGGSGFVSSLVIGGSADLYLYRDAAGTLAQRNGTNAQTLRVYSTYTSGSVYERLSLSTTATTGATIAVETLGATADLDLTFTPAGTGSVNFPAGTYVTSTGYFITSGVTAGGNSSVNYHAVGFRTRANGEVAWTSEYLADAVDTALFRDSAGVVKVTDGGSNYRDLKLRNLLNVEYHQMTEMTAPSAPATNSVRIYAEDNGSGKTRLMALFATGAAQQIAIEP